MVLGQSINENTLGYFVSRFGLQISGELPVRVSNINRTMMARVLSELGLTTGVEVGVAEGLHAQTLCENIPGLTLHAVDVYQKYSGYKEYADPEDCFRQALVRLKSYNVLFHRKFSMEVAAEFKDKSLDFVYIDGAHDFKNVADDICEWSKKVRVGGIVFGHDYKFWRPWKSRYLVDVRPVVDAYCYAKNVRPWFVLMNDLLDPVFGRDNPGWMFVRQREAKI